MTLPKVHITSPKRRVRMSDVNLVICCISKYDWILSLIKLVRQAYHGNVFVGNHCKIILKNYEKLYDVVSDEPEFHEHISERFRICSEVDKLISAKRFFDRNGNKHSNHCARGWKFHKILSKWKYFLKNTWTNFWCTLFFGQAQNIGIL